MLCRKYSSISFKFGSLFRKISFLKPKASTSLDIKSNHNSDDDFIPKHEINTNNQSNSLFQNSSKATSGQALESRNIIDFPNKMSCSPILDPNSNVNTSVIINPNSPKNISDNFDMQKYINTISIFNPIQDISSLSVMKPNIYMNSYNKSYNNLGYSPIISPRPFINSNIIIKPNSAEQISTSDNSIDSKDQIESNIQPTTEITIWGFKIALKLLKYAYYFFKDYLPIISFRNYRSISRYISFLNEFSYFSHISICDKHSAFSLVNIGCKNSWFGLINLWNTKSFFGYFNLLNTESWYGLINIMNKKSHFSLMNFWNDVNVYGLINVSWLLKQLALIFYMGSNSISVKNVIFEILSHIMTIIMK